MKKSIIYILLACISIFVSCDKIEKESKEDKLSQFIKGKNFEIAPSISTLKLDYVIFHKIVKKSTALLFNVGEHEALVAFDVTVKPNISVEDIKSNINGENVTITYNPNISYEFFHKVAEATILKSNKSFLAKSLNTKEINEIKNHPSVRDSLISQLKNSPIEKLVHTTFQNYMRSNCVAMGFNENNIKFVYESKDLIKLKN